MQVLATLQQLERVSSFQEFVQIFSQFGNEMVEFAHLTGDRQNVGTVSRPSNLRPLSLSFINDAQFSQNPPTSLC